MSQLPPLDWSKITLVDMIKGAAAVMLLAGAAYSFVVKSDKETASYMIAAALYVAGDTADALKLKGAFSKSLQVQQLIMSDTENIRDNPAQPGTPLSRGERVERTNVLTDVPPAPPAPPKGPLGL